MNEETIKFKFYGDGIKIGKIVLPNSVKITRCCTNLFEGSTPTLLDPFFYHNLNSNTYKSVYDFSSTILNGLILNEKARIELWKKGKRLRSLSINELMHSNELIPIFCVNEKNIHLQDAHYLIERSIGLINIFSFELKLNFLELVSFSTTNLFDTKILFDIVITESKVSKKHCNPLIINQHIEKCTK